MSEHDDWITGGTHAVNGADRSGSRDGGESGGAAGETNATNDYMGGPAWDIPDLMFPSLGADHEDHAAGAVPVFSLKGSSDSLDTSRPAHTTAADPLGLEEVADPTAEEEQEKAKQDARKVEASAANQPKGNNDVTMVLQPIVEPIAPTHTINLNAAGETVPLPTHGRSDGNTMHAEGDATSKSGKRGSNGKRALIIGGVVIVVAAVAIAGGVMWWRHQQNQQQTAQAVSVCEQAAGKANSASDKLQKALSDAKTAQQTGIDQVADASVIDALNNAVTKAEAVKSPASCDATLGIAALETNTKTNTTLTSSINEATTSVTSATKAVTDSMQAKTNTVKQQLQTAINDAQKLYDSSANAVLDESTRTKLQTAISNASAYLQQESPDLASMQTAISDLQTASEAVNASMSAYEEQQRQYYYYQQQQQQNQNNGTGDNGTGTGDGTTNGTGDGTTTGNSGTTQPGTSGDGQQVGNGGNTTQPTRPQ